MNLQPVSVHPSGPQTFTCAGCSRRVRQVPGRVVVWADPAGPAFQAYYCPACVPAQEITKAAIAGC